MSFILIQVSGVQTYLGHKTAEYLSKKLNVKVEIGTIDIEFVKTIVLTDVYIEDQHHDTLLYSKKLKVGIRNINLKKHKIYIKDIVLLQTEAAIVKYKSDEDFNFQFIIDAFDSKDTVKKSNEKWDIRLGEITLVNSDFTYRNEHDTLHTSGINYFDLHTTNINGRFSDVNVDNDTIHATIDYLSTIEKSGFILKNLSSYVKINSKEIKLDELRIKTPESTIATDLSFSYGRYKDFNDFINRVKINALFEPSQLEMHDISYFASELKGLYKNLTLSGKITGRINDLRGKDLAISLGGSTEFMGDVSLTGLPKIDETIIYLNVKSLTSNYSDLRQIPIPPFDKYEKLKVPVELAKLGNMKFKGTFTGLYNDFYAYGDFSSDLGKLSSDLSVRHDENKNKEFYKGNLKSMEFDFGKLFDFPMLGKISMNIDIDGEGVKPEDINAKLRGTISSLDLKGYSYKNINVQGNIAQQIFKGKLDVKDDNIDFDFNGDVDFSEKQLTLDFITTLNKADLGALHFVNTTKKTDLSTQMIINVKGNGIDNLVGQVHFDNTVYREGNEVYKMSVFNLTSEEKNNIKTIKLTSDFIDASIRGTFKLLEMEASVQNLLNSYLPSLFIKKNNLKHIVPQNFEYSFLFKKTDRLTALFAPKISIAPQTFIKGNFNSVMNQFSMNGNSARLDIYGYVFKDWNLEVTSAKKDFNFNMDTKRLYFSDSLWMDSLTVATQTHSDSVNLSIKWNNETEKVSKGDIKAFVTVGGKDKFQFKILPSQFTIADSTWSLNRTNELTVDSTYITVNDLRFEHGDQAIALNGIISGNKTDQMKLGFNNFNLSNLNAFVKPFGLKLNGRIDGESTITDLYQNMLFTSNTTFKSLYVNNNALGDGELQSVWDKNKEALYLHGSFTLGLVPNILLSGYYYPKKEEENIDMELNLQALQMQLFEPFIKEYCSDFKGFFSGNLFVKGSLNKPLLSGMLSVNAKKVTVNYLNTTYNFSHNIAVDNNSFGVENMILYDMNHNPAAVTGKVYHDNFKNFQLDFDITPQKFMCLNTTEANNNLYYGKAFVTGIVNIYGFVNDNININANVRTEKITSNDKSNLLALKSNTEITRFFIPLSGPSEVDDNNFIRFVKKDTLTKKDDYEVKLGGVTLDFDLNVTSDAEIQLIFDQKVGDIIKSRGNGNIKMRINSLGEFKMYGEYVIENGDYLFTLQNVINKRFDIENGSIIKWSGVPYKADVNIDAVYKARASLKPFFPEDSSTTYKKRYPIDLKLLMTGDLLSPLINFDIGIPTVDAGTRQQIMSYINNDAEMNRQVFSLLILNSFVTPYQLGNSGGGPGAFSAAGSNTSELLSNQLSNMLSKISNDFDIGVNYRPGDEINKEELEVALSTQLFNDRLTIDSNVGMNSNNNQSTSNIVGDVTANYSITDDGKVKIKAFSKANDNNQVYLGPYTQGLGIFYREEFDVIGDLYKHYLHTIKSRKEKKKEGE